LDPPLQAVKSATAWQQRLKKKAGIGRYYYITLYLLSVLHKEPPAKLNANNHHYCYFAKTHSDREGNTCRHSNADAYHDNRQKQGWIWWKKIQFMVPFWSILKMLGWGGRVCTAAYTPSSICPTERARQKYLQHSDNRIISNSIIQYREVRDRIRS
jgi:hypothetical protein